MTNKRIEKRNQYRTTVCSGCHYNYYNFPKAEADNIGVSIPEDYSCWYIDKVKRGKCPLRRE